MSWAYSMYYTILQYYTADNHSDLYTNTKFNI